MGRYEPASPLVASQSWATATMFSLYSMGCRSRSVAAPACRRAHSRLEPQPALGWGLRSFVGMSAAVDFRRSRSLFVSAVQLKILAQSFFGRGGILEAAHPNLTRRRPVGMPNVRVLLRIVKNPR
jgi:hypothetical protein